MAFDNSNIPLYDIEKLEHKYLMKYWYFLKFAEDEIVKGMLSMEDIRKDAEALACAEDCEEEKVEVEVEEVEEKEEKKTSKKSKKSKK